MNDNKANVTKCNNEKPQIGSINFPPHEFP